MNDLAAVHVIVRGRVQGVFFRAFAMGKATGLGLTGYVRNLPDGMVEVRAEGERGPLQKLINHLGKGPPAAKVTEVTTEWSEYSGEYKGFEIKYNVR